MIPLVVASERGAAQTMYVTAYVGLKDCDIGSMMNWNALERAIVEGDNPVQVKSIYHSRILSSAGHVEPCVNLPGPSGKAKYS